MNAMRIAAVVAVLLAFASAFLWNDEAVIRVGLALPAWIALEACWRLFDPER